MKKHVIYLMALGLLIFLGCQKEKSFETGGSPSEGTLTSDGVGDCLPKTVNGTYEVATQLTPANTISVEVNVTTTGTYVIYTDTVNGIFFRATGLFSAIGTNTVTLRGTGTPFNDGIHNFVVKYGSSVCDVQVTVLPAGGGSPAVYTLEGAPGACTGATPNGDYAVGVPLGGIHSVPISVNVTTIGTYNISTVFQGMTFSKTGAFLTTGIQPVLLMGSGTPTTAGANVVPLTVGTSTCNFTVNVGTAAQFTIDCPSVSVNGTYSTGIALDGSNTVEFDVNITTAGVYNITTTTVNGMTFSAAGNFPSTGTDHVVLAGTGTPVTAGNTSIPLPGPPCNISITVVAGPTIDWNFTEGGTNVYQGAFDDGIINVAGPITIYGYQGSSATGGIVLAITDFGGGIQNNETYSSSSSTGNSCAFIFTDGATVLQADPSTAGVTITLKVTTHNTTTKTITGTFSGTCKDGAVTKNITLGTFTGTYP
jgi:hypothetical protein